MKSLDSSIIGSIVSFIVLAVVAAVATNNNWVFVFAASIGAMGGLLHEFVQSGGKVFFPAKDKKNGNVYQGAVAGLVLGAISGVLLVKGLVDLDNISKTTINYYSLGYETFAAGLVLKGISQAFNTKVDKETAA